MKTIKLLNLSLKNFKGIKEFSIDLNGKDARVFGDNATGKTTLYDAFLWLLFNKDSQNKTKFSIKTLTPEGEEINNLEHEVEAVLLVDGQELTLKKVHYENWVRERGALEKTFKNNTNDYFIDGVPTPEGQYKKAIESLIDEVVFKILTSPTYYNEQLTKLEDRRKPLFDLAGNPSDQDIISANEKLQELTGILKGKKIEEHKLVIAARKKAIKEELESTPVRISEIHSLMPEEIDVSSIEVEVMAIEKQLDEHATQINNIKNGAAIIDKEALAKQLEFELKQIQDELEVEATERGFKVQTKIQEERSNVAILNREKDDKQHEVSRAQREVEAIDKLLVELRNEWAVVNERAFENTHNEDTCPTCNQSLPAEQIQYAHEKALNNFNLKKSNDLEKINSDGKKMSAKKASLIEQIEKLKKSAEELVPKIEAKEKTIEKLTNDLDSLRNEIQNARQDKRYLSKLTEIENVNKQIWSLKENAQESVTGVEKEVAELRSKRTELNSQIAQQKQVVASKKRIAELEARQKELAIEFEKTDKELFLIEEFTRVKVDMIEEKINGKFELARFKLFDKQINGALKDTCETTYNGVPYGTGLNNAARINVGLDIIRTLSDHYGFKVPIFIDNAEAVTDLIDMDTQVISLVVPQSFDDYPEDIKSMLISKHGSYEEAQAEWKKKYGSLHVEKQSDDESEVA